MYSLLTVLFVSKYGQNGQFRENFSLFINKKVFFFSRLCWNEISFSRGYAEMRYISFFGTFCLSIGCTNYLQPDLYQNSGRIGSSQQKLQLVKKKTSLENSFSRDVGAMRFGDVCFFGVFSSFSICTVCLQSDLSLDMAKMVTFEKTSLFISKKSLL